MKVSELIAELQKQPPDAKVCVYPAAADETGSDVICVETFKNEERGLETIVWLGYE
jgi:hypothetical protein